MSAFILLVILSVKLKWAGLPLKGVEITLIHGAMGRTAKWRTVFPSQGAVPNEKAATHSCLVVDSGPTTLKPPEEMRTSGPRAYI
jgi:hypothetical protein